MRFGPSRFVRLALGLSLTAMFRSKTRPEHPVAFFLDELAQLGHFGPVEEAVSIVRGFGARLWLFVQDLSQLESVYPKWRTFLANTTLQTFGTQDQMTARYVSEALGNETISFSIESTSENRGWGAAQKSTSRTTAEHRHARALLQPDEVRRLDPSQVIVLEQGQAPELVQRVSYLEDRVFSGKWDDNPMEGSPFLPGA
jgi:type IV secretion system protein VirD4